VEAHARGRPNDRCLPQAHAHEPPRTWNHPHHGQAPQPPTPPDRSTAWMRLAAPGASAWHRRVGLGVLTMKQNAYRGETLEISAVETSMRGGMRAHDLRQGMKRRLRGSHNRDVLPEITAGKSVQAPVRSHVLSMKRPSHMRNRHRFSLN
jgi:hypothetical protein